ncbi:MAG: M24 family metallopeptidase [Alphaproteobacteria bacterium]
MIVNLTGQEATQAQAIQYGAMEGTSPPAHLDQTRLYRLGRVRALLAEFDYAGILLYDQLNIRYATDATNMQLWCSHNEARYCLILTQGPVILFDYGGKDLLTKGLPTIDETRPAQDFYYMYAGNNQDEKLASWAGEIDDLLKQYGAGNKRLAVDRIAPIGTLALDRRGYDIMDGFTLMEEARKLKSAGELDLMRYAIHAAENAIQMMRQHLSAGITENALWAKLHEGNIAQGGEWIETRLLASGPRTNPWFQESSMRQIQKGDMVAFDTDMIGPYGYCADISRSFVCDSKPSDDQKRLYAEANLQLEHNKALLKPGISLRELSSKLRIPPDQFKKIRYSVAMHGVGLCDEYPFIPYFDDFDEKGFDAVLLPGMCLCVEALVALEGKGEAVKLEEQITITEDGFEQLSSLPLESAML